MSRRHPSRVDSARWALVRRAVFDRDGWRCRACGRAGRLEVDHVRPVALGGDPWALANLQALCVRCHLGKTRGETGARLPAEVRAWRELLAERMTS